MTTPSRHGLSSGDTVVFGESSSVPFRVDVISRTEFEASPADGDQCEEAKGAPEPDLQVFRFQCDDEVCSKACTDVKRRRRVRLPRVQDFFSF